MFKMLLYFFKGFLLFYVLHISGNVFVISQTTLQDKQFYLDAHNFVRRQLAFGKVGFGNRTQPPAADLPLLQWSDELADKAEDDAENCVWAHTKVSKIFPNLWYQVGQNMDRNPYYDPSRYINEYYKEWFYYRVMNNRSADIFDDSNTTGHYTQLVWNQTQYVGCGHSYCSNLSSFLSYCNYGLAGNLVGALPYTIGPACTRCKPDNPLCLDGLCVSQATCDKLEKNCTCNVTCENGGVLDMTTCTCKECPAGWESFFCDKPCINFYDWCTYNTPRVNNCTANWSYCPKLCNACTYRPPACTVSNRDNILSKNFTIDPFPKDDDYPF